MGKIEISSVGIAGDSDKIMKIKCEKKNFHFTGLFNNSNSIFGIFSTCWCKKKLKTKAYKCYCKTCEHKDVCFDKL